MNRKTVIALLCAVISVQFLHAKDFYWVGASNDWWNAASYSSAPEGPGGTEMPGSEDRVVLTPNQRVFVDDSTISFFSTIKEVQTAGTNIVSYFNIKGNANLGCYYGSLAITYHPGTILVKTGEGKLTFSKRGSVDLYKTSGKTDTFHYMVGIDLRQGELELEPMVETGNHELRHRYGDVIVAEGCTLYGVEGANTWLESLSGAGLVTNRVTVGSRLQIVGAKDAPTVFSGKLRGFGYFMPQGHTWFTGTQNTVGSTTFRPAGYAGGENLGILGFMTFAGPAGTPSSLGTGEIEARYPARLLYLGSKGETIERNTALYNTLQAPFTWDAGAYGGLQFIGSFVARTETEHQQRLVLTGSNAMECVVSSRFVCGSSAKSSFHITKRGTGTWRFSAPPENSMLSGVIGVEEGVLGFDVLKDAGLLSSAGFATELYEDACNHVTNGLRAAGHAHFLGAGPKQGIFRYCGNVPRTIKNRPLALKGQGRIEAPDSPVLNWVGVSGLGEGEKSLIVDCREWQTNRYANIVDGEGVVSVKKVGPGDLVLSGELSFSGDLVSSGGGTLTVADISGRKYEYYRLTVRETVYTSTNELFSQYKPLTTTTSKGIQSRSVLLGEFGLYDSNGARLNTWGAAADAEYESMLDRGQIALESQDSYSIMTKSDGNKYRPWRLLDNSCSGGLGLNVLWANNLKMPKLSDPLSWVSLVLRMKDGVAAVRYFDVNLLGKSDEASYGRMPNSISVSASGDGLNYEELFCTNDCITASFPQYDYSWLSDGTSAYAASKSIHPEDIAHSKIPLPHSTVQTDYRVLDNVRSISADAISTLRYEGPSPMVVSGLKADAAGIGTIEGFAFAAEGILYLENADTFSNVIDVSANLGGVANLPNLKQWALSINGQPGGLHSIASVSSEGIRVVKPAFRIIIR